MVAKLENGMALLRAKAVENNGACLSSEYAGVDHKYRFRCASDHEWYATFYSVVARGQWCARCSGRKAIPESQLDKAKGVASLQGGNCLSNQYINSKLHLNWRCAEGHEWKATYSNVVTHGKWCPWCAGNKVDATKQFAQAYEVARSHGGTLLSLSYARNKAPLRWRCSEGHEWEAAFATVVRRGAWCGRCRGTQREAVDQLARAQAVAAKKAGQCLSTEYINNNEKMAWRCERGHEWKAPFYSVAQAGTWCPVCSDGLKERLVRHTLENLFGLPFKKHRPNWLRNPITGRLMELDGFNPELRLAFEYQGPQHYKVVHPFKMDVTALEDMQRRDAYKKAMCLEHRITLLEIPYTVEWQALPEWISQTLENTPKSESLLTRMGNWRLLPPTEWLATDAYSIEALQKFAHAKNGDCLSKTYMGVKVKHRWRCAESHEWESTWDSLRNQNSWCPICCGNIILDPLGELRELARSRDGELVSTAFMGMQRKHRWRCCHGHEWEAKASHVKHAGSWCPICSKRVLLDPLKQLQEIAELRGGRCLSEKYVSSTTKLRWRCLKSHEWDAVPSSIKTGKWCPTCAITQRTETRQKRRKAK